MNASPGCTDHLTGYKSPSVAAAHLHFNENGAERKDSSEADDDGGLHEPERSQDSACQYDFIHSSVYITLPPPGAQIHDSCYASEKRKGSHTECKFKQSLTVALSHIYHFLLAASHSVWQKVVNVNTLAAYCFAICHCSESLCRQQETTCASDLTCNPTARSLLTHWSHFAPSLPLPGRYTSLCCSKYAVCQDA